MDDMVLEEGFHWCPCCGIVKVDNEYDYCYGCMCKWETVYRSCLKHGYSKGAAISKADEEYPRKIRFDNECDGLDISFR